MFRRSFAYRAAKGKVGYAIPDSNVFVGIPPKAMSTSELFGGKRVLVFAVPVAYTGNCSTQLPQYAQSADKLKQKLNVSAVCCLTTNDSFVCDKWAKEHSVGDAITMISDPGHSLLKNLGHEIDLPVLGGDRFARVALVIEDGVIKKLWKEKDGKSLDATTAEAVLTTEGEE